MKGGSAALAVAAVLAGCGGGSAELSRLRTEHGEMQRRFDSLVDRDPVVREALEAGGGVAIGLRPSLVEDVLQQVSARYLDRVVLDLPLERTVHETGELRVKTFLGHVTVGTWTVEATIHRVRGRLRARAPTVAAAPGNALRVDVPVALEEGRGAATVHFAWKGRSLASIVCRDFEVERRLEGRVLSGEYTISGTFELSAGPETVRAEPNFPPREFRLRLDLDPASWAQVRTAIEEQDQLLRCGLGLDADDLLPRLRARLQEGFDVKLPPSLFREVDFPAAVRESATIEGRQVDLSVKTRELKVSPTAVWYSADVRTRIAEASPP